MLISENCETITYISTVNYSFKLGLALFHPLLFVVFEKCFAKVGLHGTEIWYGLQRV